MNTLKICQNAPTLSRVNAMLPGASRTKIGRLPLRLPIFVLVLSTSCAVLHGLSAEEITLKTIEMNRKQRS